MSRKSKECAFCSETARISGEHIWSAWMDEFFPGQKIFANVSNDFQDAGHGKPQSQKWTCSRLNWKAYVVCERCNNTWMSDIEKFRAKPAMESLILGKMNVPINQSRATDIAIFAFKTGVILDHMAETRGRFFPRSVRCKFRTKLRIPNNVKMWLTGFLPPGGGAAQSFYYALPKPNEFELYVTTYRVGRLVFQLVAHKKSFFIDAAPSGNFDTLAVPFWPKIPDGFIWPPNDVLRTAEQFDSFASRWGNLHFKRA